MELKSSRTARPQRAVPTVRAVAVIAALAAFAAPMTGCGSGEDTPTTPAPADTAPDLTAAPAQVQWRGYHGVLVPIGADGPRDYSEAAATGFTHTPQGAALAAIVHTIRMSLAPDAHWTSIAAHELAPGPGKDEWASGRVLLSITGDADPATAPRLRGYTITHYTRAEARIDIVTSFPDTSIAVNTATVAWIAQDWRLKLPDPADTTPVVRTVDTVQAAVTLEPPR